MTEGSLNNPKKRDTDDLLTEFSNTRDQRTIAAINGNRLHHPRPNAAKMQCVGCRHADIHVVCNDRPNMWGTPWGTHAANELSIYCYKRASIVKFPYERCKARSERPKITLDKW